MITRSMAAASGRPDARLAEMPLIEESLSGSIFASFLAILSACSLVRR